MFLFLYFYFFCEETALHSKYKEHKRKGAKLYIGRPKQWKPQSVRKITVALMKFVILLFYEFKTFYSVVIFSKKDIKSRQSG